MSQKWISWVPTIGGRLSYSVIGDSSQNSPAITVNVTNEKQRLILSHQKRNLNDSILASFLLKAVCGADTDFWFLLSSYSADGSVEKDPSLHGSISIFMNGRREWRQFESEFYNGLRQGFVEDASEFDPRSVADNVSGEARKSCLIQFLFTLERSGVLKIELADEIYKDAYTPDSIFLAAKQAFFFLKDLTHVHQHHHSKTDSLVDLYADKQDDAWQADVLRVLYRRILGFKRAKSIESYECALGILTYTESFIKICEKHSSSFCLSPMILNHSLLKESVKLNKEKCVEAENASESAFDNLKTNIFLFLGLLISITGLAKLINPPVYIDSLSLPGVFIAKVISHPSESAMLFLITPVMIWAWRLKLRNKPYYRALFKILLTFKKQTSTIASLFTSLLLICFAFYLFYKGFNPG